MPLVPRGLPTLAEVLARTTLTPTGCREWQGTTLKGYPLAYRVLDGRRTRLYLHRYVLTLTLGRPIAPGHGALHRCDNPPCLAAEHLYEGTQRDNVRDAVERGRATGGGARGAQHHRARLTPDSVRLIRASDEPQAVLAARYGVTQQAVSDVRHGRSWKAVV